MRYLWVDQEQDFYMDLREAFDVAQWTVSRIYRDERQSHFLSLPKHFHKCRASWPAILGFFERAPIASCSCFDSIERSGSRFR